MPFQSILFDNPESGREINKQEAPDFFADLNLDQIVESITSGRDEYNLKPFFYIPLKRVEAINYRQEIRVLSASVRGRSKLEEVALCHPVMPVSDGLSS